jgi:hypothetical protein
MVINDMKKTIVALALVAGLTSFAGSAKAAVITANLNQFTSSSSHYVGFGYFNGAITSDYRLGIDGSWTPSWVMLGPRYVPAFGSIGFRNRQQNGDGYYNGGTHALSGGTLIDELMSYQTSEKVDVAVTSGGYWAVRFNQGGGNFNYGYVQVDVTSSGMTFGMAGVETTPNLAIRAGAVPEPSTYALLGIGAMGLLMVLRRKKTA